MSGLLRRLRSRRGSEPGDAAPLPSSETGDDALPAGAEPDLLGARTRSRRRGRARRRLRHVERVREIYLRDLGGFVYELHRLGSGQDERHAAVMSAKLERLDSLDTERAELQERLGDASGELLLREPGIGGTCPTCGELHGSEARFCTNCGMPLVAGAARPVPGLSSGEQPALPAGAEDPMAGVRAHVAAAQAADPIAAPAEPPTEVIPDAEVVPEPGPEPVGEPEDAR